MKTIQVFDNIRYICRINQEIMEAQHHDQVGGVKSLAERLRSGQI